MKPSMVLACASLFIIVFSTACFAESGGRLYGKVTTVDDDTYEGLIRWDKNEASWNDILNGDKELHRAGRESRHRKRITVFGIKIGDRWGSDDVDNVQSGVSFGHIAKIEPVRGDAVRLTLKSGERIRLESGSTDIGDDVRGIVIEDPKEGEIELEWDDVAFIELSQGPADLASAFGERLYGTMTTRRGGEYTGWVSWDKDELFTKDVLDGEYKSHSRKIEFGKIKSIERRSSSSATVALANGEEIVLRESNDVDDSNRGISIYDPAIGEITSDWDEFEKLEFTKPPAALPYDHFNGGKRLEGTVYTEDGDKHTGAIRWDDDEEYTWELLDGVYRDLEFDIEFGHIKEIKPAGLRASDVSLWDGRSFKLRGSNDVDNDNNGIIVTTNEGTKIEIEWDEVERVEFVR